MYITTGVIFFIASLIAFLAAGNQDIHESNRRSLLWVGGILAAALFLVRTFVFQSNPGFSPEGLFFFNPHPIVQIIYIFGLALTALPAIDALANKFGRSGYSHLVRYGFIAEVMGGIILVTSTNTLVLYAAGWIIGAVYLVLWTSLLFSQRAWSSAR